MATSDLYTDLVKATRAEVHQSYGGTEEAFCQCPSCLVESSRKEPRHSFSRRGWHCFSCGDGGNLRRMAELVGLDAGEIATWSPVASQPRGEPKPQPTWMANPMAYVERYEKHPRRFETWASYKPLSREAIINHRLGVGVLPSSRCKHERLVVPVFDGTMVVGLRGRSLGCDCGKWVASGGTTLAMMPLYNQVALHPGCIVWLVENPVDALMISERVVGNIAVAIYSTSYWRNEWADTIAKYQPEMAIPCLDHDLVGQGGDGRRAEFIEAWRAKIMAAFIKRNSDAAKDLIERVRNANPPMPRAKIIEVSLKRRGVYTRNFVWPDDAPYKTDPGWMIMKMNGGYEGRQVKE